MNTAVEYPPHKTAQLFPELDGEMFDELKSDIRTNGLQCPITVYHNDVESQWIIDGRARNRACLELGAPAAYQRFDDLSNVVAFVVAQNLHRRHLSTSQRALIAARALPMLEHEARLRKLAGVTLDGNPAKGKSVAKAGRMFNVSGDTVAAGKKVLKHSAKSVRQAVMRGEVSVNDAAEVATMAKPEQCAALKKVRAGKSRTLRKAAGRASRRSKPQPVAPALAPDFAPAVVPADELLKIGRRLGDASVAFQRAGAAGLELPDFQVKNVQAIATAAAELNRALHEFRQTLPAAFCLDFDPAEVPEPPRCYVAASRPFGEMFDRLAE